MNNFWNFEEISDKNNDLKKIIENMSDIEKAKINFAQQDLHKSQSHSYDSLKTKLNETIDEIINILKTKEFLLCKLNSEIKWCIVEILNWERAIDLNLATIFTKDFLEKIIRKSPTQINSKLIYENDKFNIIQLSKNELNDLKSEIQESIEKEIEQKEIKKSFKLLVKEIKLFSSKNKKELEIEKELDLKIQNILKKCNEIIKSGDITQKQIDNIRQEFNQIKEDFKNNKFFEKYLRKLKYKIFDGNTLEKYKKEFKAKWSKSPKWSDLINQIKEYIQNIKNEIYSNMEEFQKFIRNWWNFYIDFLDFILELISGKRNITKTIETQKPKKLELKAELTIDEDWIILNFDDSFVKLCDFRKQYISENIFINWKKTNEINIDKDGILYIPKNLLIDGKNIITIPWNKEYEQTNTEFLGFEYKFEFKKEYKIEFKKENKIIIEPKITYSKDRKVLTIKFWKKINKLKPEIINKILKHITLNKETIPWLTIDDDWNCNIDIWSSRDWDLLEVWGVYSYDNTKVEVKYMTIEISPKNESEDDFTDYTDFGNLF